MHLSKKDLVSISDLSKEEITSLLTLSMKLKRQVWGKPLAGKVLGMLFSKSSTRTRVSFEVGMHKLGGHAIFLSQNDIQLGRGESIEDTAKVLSRFIDGIMIRTFAHRDVELLAEHAHIPVINGLTDDEHPCQILADLMTVLEHKRSLNVKIAYVGDGNNVAASLSLACETLGIECTVSSPKGYTMPAAIQARTPSVKYLIDPREGVRGADVIYTDVWTSMGQEREYKKRIAAFKKYQINRTLTSLAKSDHLFLHCLPAHRGEEVSAEVIDGPNSVVFDEAENRMHAQMAVLLALMR